MRVVSLLSPQPSPAGRGGLKMGRFALQKSAAPDLADKFAVTRRDLAANSHDVRPAFDRQAFKRIVVNVHSLRLHRDRATIVWVIDHQVRIAAGLNRSFARK